MLNRIPFLWLLLMLGVPPLSWSQNAITAENALAGNPASEWDISGAGDLSIQGFSTDISVNKGDTVHFKIKTDASAYSITIYRIGYYQGNGARKIDTGTITASLPQVQPDDLFYPQTGLTDCGNWSPSAYWHIPANAVSGIYIAKLTRTDNGGASHIVFIVRDDASHSDLLFQTSDATWQAYNVYGGNSLYVGSTSFPAGHAVKVSYNRPFVTRNGGGGGGAEEDWLFNAEYPMIRFLERNGYDVTYMTNVDADRHGALITNHKVFLSVGHDEYWSGAQHSNVEAARNSGTHLAFFSGNEVYWKTRWENSTEGSSTPYRTLVCYKEGTLGENACGGKCDPLPDVWTGLWRDGCSFAAADGCRPENALSGQISWADEIAAIQVPDTYKNLRLWRNTSIATLQPGTTATLSNGTLGYEWDFEQYGASYPQGRIKMSATTINSQTHHLSLYKHSGGALVFGAGTVQWSWGLDGNHDRGTSVPDVRMQQATVNILADMSAQPASLQPGLTAAAASEDQQAPVSVISTPANGSTVASGTPVTITGTATDANTVAGVEVSVDGGTTWTTATGMNNWTFTFTPATQGNIVIRARAYDDSGNMESVFSANGNEINITVGGQVATACPCTVFQPAQIPATPLQTDNQPIELGMKFGTTTNGYITGIRFYKESGNSGVHKGHLWSSDGTLLAEATFINETASGWQQVQLANPIAVVQGSYYIASYHSSAGFYASTDNFFTARVSNGPLYALANDEQGANGVYKYGPDPSFPTDDFESSNYWVDIVFDTAVADDITPPVITGTSPANASSGVSTGASVNITFSEELAAATVNSSSVELRDGSNTIVPATISYSAGVRRIVVTPNSPFNYSSTYSVLIKGAMAINRITDVAGNPLQADSSFIFTTAAPPPPPPVEGTGGPILVIGSASNPFSRYYAEILRATGFNSFSARDISQVNTDMLNTYDVVIVGEIPLTAAQVTMLTDWTNSGGTIIAMRPPAQLAPLLGISLSGGTLANRYLLVNTAAAGPGFGIVNQTLQFHGTADLYTLNGATSLATLYNAAATATNFPAATINNVGSSGGKAVAFSFDLARSIVYTRQGNPAWAGQKRDGQSGPIRSDDLFYGNASFDPQTDWVDLNKVAIPQADEQQHFLANIIIQCNLHRKPLPRFWFLPKGLKAAIVMTGDDHGNGGTTARFNQYLSQSTANTQQAVDDWTAIRGTSYIYPNTPITNQQAVAFEAQGFEIALHLNTNCENYTPASYENNLTSQLAEFSSLFPGVPAPTTNRTHCIAFSDWASQPKAELAKGIRLDANYYYWPEAWVQNRPGMFTGSGMPMRFADLDGSLIDCYQVATQMTDESGITYSTFVNSLLDKAKGPEGYYGVFCANMHTDNATSSGSDAIIASAKARQIPVVSARQMLSWLDGRNSSSFADMSWTGNTLNFSVAVGPNANNLRAMLPVNAGSGQVTSITRNGAAVTFTTETIKGISYAFFPAQQGTYAATYSIDNTPPAMTDLVTAQPAAGTATITWTTDEPATSKVDYGTSPDSLSLSVTNDSLVVTHRIELTGLTAGHTYHFRVSSADAAANNATIEGTPQNSFVVATTSCLQDATSADFNGGQTGTTTHISNLQDGEVMLSAAIRSEFTGTTVPAEWTSGIWNGGGSITVNGGVIALSGAHVNTSAQFSPGTSIEFAGTYSAGGFQNVGFSTGADFNAPWVTIGTSNNGPGVYARTSNNTETLLFTPAEGSQHRYRIQWNANNFQFYVDNSTTPVVTLPFVVASNMVAQVSNFPVGPILSVDYIHISPYSTPGVFTSRVFDAGQVTQWATASWTADVPASTSIVLSQRQGNSPQPDQTWTSFTAIPTNGSPVSGSSRYFQYQATLATTDPAVTPALHQFTVCSDAAPGDKPVITLQPQSQTTCAGSTVYFVSTANPPASIQWETSIDSGANWTTIVGATDDTLTINVTPSDNAKRYRSVFTNTTDSSHSDIATLTVISAPQVYISPVDESLCQSTSNVQLRLDSASGVAPYTIVVNSKSYPNVLPGSIFATIAASSQTIWADSITPGTPYVTDNQAIEVGVKFRASAAGYVQGIRFYKGAANGGTHVGSLWAASGTRIATATFINETASGWQEVRFASPVQINANTTYIASYYSPDGGFAINSGYFATSGVTRGVLQALQAGVDGPNGVFKYGGGFPNGGNNANYWVDVIFQEKITSPQLQTFTVTSIIDANNCVNTGDSLTSTSVSVQPSPEGNITSPFQQGCAGSDIQLVYTSTTGTSPFTLQINDSVYSNIVSGTPFNSGIAATAGSSSSSIWNDNIIGGEPGTADNDAIEVGVKFRSAVAGKIKGIRFYKRASNTGIHKGSLWSATGTQLATATFINETASGWQTVLFASPVDIQPGVTYVASYYAPSGNYAYTAQYFRDSSVSNGPLTALQTGIDGTNGVFKYTAGDVFPNESFNNANYWVDVVFDTGGGNTFALTSITDAQGCVATGSPISTVSVSAGAGSATAMALQSKTNISCYRGIDGTITVGASGGTAPYIYTITGPTVNTTGRTSGLFTGLKAGMYSITVSAASDECGVPAVMDSIVLTQPPASSTDISLGSDITDNFFFGNGAENTIVFNISEIAGAGAEGDTIRIVKQPNYNFVYDSTTTSIDVNGSIYQLDNTRWRLINSPSFVSLVLISDTAGNNIVTCAQRVYVAVKVKRNTANRSAFSMNAQLRRANGEITLINNNTSILFFAE